MADPKASTGKTSTSKPSAGEVVCEPGRHVDCLHARMAEKRAAAKPG